ncbi:MAG: LEA type 2 family protein [Gemmatimonadales bacterium]|jgi:LEA14-like dessication related protein
MTLGVRSRPWLRLFLPAAALFLGSCAALRQLSFEQPTVELDMVEISGLDLSGVSLVLLLDVYNPNAYEIQTTRIEAALDLEDTHFGTAALDSGVPLAPASHTVIRLPASFTWEGAGAAARALLGRGKVSYELDTRLRLQTSLGGQNVAFRHRGEVQINDLVR